MRRPVLFSLLFLLLSLPLCAQIAGLDMAEPAPQGPPEALVTIEIPNLQETGAKGTDVLELGPEGIGRIVVHYAFPAGFHQTKQEEMFTVSLPPSSPVEIREISYPPGVEEEGLINYYGEAGLDITLVLRPGMQGGEYRVPLSAAYQLCDEEGTCFFPEEAVKELTIVFGEKTAPAATDIADAAGAPAPSGGKLSLAVLLRYLLFAFIGGILLNVMPCVLPVLSIRALNLVKQSGNKRRELFAGSLLYTAGILLTMSVLAAAVTVLKLSGRMVGWGFQFQDPGFVVFLTILVFVFSLSLFDVYVFQAPTMNRAVQRAGQKGYIGSFFNGIIAVLLATPCTAPLLGTALGFAFSQTPPVIFGFFLLVGLGFALPFILVGIRPTVIRHIPKPGPWMNTFKELMGFLLLGTAVYLLSILRFQVSSKELIKIILFLLLLAFFLWIYGKTAKPTTEVKRKWIILGIFIILSLSAADRLLRFEANQDTAAASTEREGWETFEPERLEAYREEDKPVLVIFSAKWCTVCKMNERTVLHTEEANALFAERGIKVLYGDFTNENPLIEEWIRSYGRAGVPVYAYYPPDGGGYELLPEVLTMDLLRSRLR